MANASAKPANRSLSLTDRVRDGRALVGLLVPMPAPATVELAAYCEFDFVILDTEHGVDDASIVEAHLRAANAARIPALVRVPGCESRGIAFALDAGAIGVMVPHVTDHSDVERIVDAVFYPPTGARSLALSTRAGHHAARDPRRHVEIAGRETLVVAQIEDVEALANVADIAAHPHVDAICIGPNDLSCSLGYPGARDHPAVRAAIGDVLDRTGRTAAAACIVASDPEDALGWRAQGAAIIIFNAETIVARHLHDLSRTMRVDLRVAASS